MAKNDGGPAFAVPCRTCCRGFVPKAWQLAKSDFECPLCKRARQNKRNAKRDLAAYCKARYQQPHVKARIKAYHATKRQSDPMYVLKRRARALVARAIKRGDVVRGVCERCASVKVDAHHEDYTKPLEVRWLCRRCHFAVERSAA